MRARRRLRFTIRAQALLLVPLLLAVPVVGYRYVQEMEAFLREGLEESLLGAARALAGALHDRPALFDLPSGGEGIGRDVYAHPLPQAPEVDGYATEWEAYLHQATALTAHPAGDTTATATYVAGKHGEYLYLLLRVRDPDVIYSPVDTGISGRADEVRLFLGNDDAPVRIRTSGPGWASALRTAGDGTTRREWRLSAEWRESDDGWQVEMRLPLRMVGSRLGIQVHDANRAGAGSLGSFPPDAPGGPGVLVLPSPEIESLIRRLGRTPGRRVWVVDAAGRIIARGGSLEQTGDAPPINPVVALLLPPPDRERLAEDPVATRLSGPEVATALSGNPEARWRSTADPRTYVVAAAHPILGDGLTLGAVVVEEASLGIETVRRRALADLFSTTLIICAIGAVVLLLFTTRLSTRLRRLRDDADTAIDSSGRVVGDLHGSHAGDEIGDLARAFASMMERLRQYNSYLERLASRLSHELRTPIAVVRSSLDNLSMAPAGDEVPVYAQRATEGLTRLETILARMSESTRLERSMDGAQREHFDLAPIVRAAIEAYTAAWPGRSLTYSGPDSGVPVHGVPDLMVQMLDKLVANAMEFGEPDKPVEVALTGTPQHARLCVRNRGPLLPEHLHGRVFESMVSVREGPAGPDPHLGLGLYIVRLIADFHGGTAGAENLPAGDGVEVCVELPVGVAGARIQPARE